MIAAAQTDVVIDVEEKPILNTVVGDNAHLAFSAGNRSCLQNLTL